MRRRHEISGDFNVWPAFTDVLGGLVVVLVFLITIFIISEVLIGREVARRGSGVEQLEQVVDELFNDLGLAKDENAALSDQMATLQNSLQTTQAERDALQVDLGDANQEQRLMEARIETLTQRAEEMTGELRRINQALGTNEEELAERDALIAEQSGRLEELDGLIKERLLDRVEELEQYTSNFLRRLRDVFADNPDIKIVGDRFVFQSEVLFSSGEADLSGDGEGDLNKFVDVYQQLANALPDDLPVIIEVQGHTDKVPLSSSRRFASNWELSTARALNVVNYLIEQGIPPERLAAVGMGEYHPIEAGDSSEALRRNRRIELKITSR